MAVGTKTRRPSGKRLSPAATTTVKFKKPTHVKRTTKVAAVRTKGPHLSKNVKGKRPSTSAAATTTKPKKPKHLKRILDSLQSQQLHLNSTNKGDESTLQAQLQDKIKMVAMQQQKFNERKREGGKRKRTLHEPAEQTVSIIPNESAFSAYSDINLIRNEGGQDEGSVVSDAAPSVPCIRKRGRRRRGIASTKGEDMNNQLTQKQGAETFAVTTVRDSTNTIETQTQDTERFAMTTLNEPAVNLEPISAPKKQRRCIGRKPVTDFKVGSIHTGKIVYIKPTLGTFVDIGCHSDAFCHISQLQANSNNIRMDPTKTSKLNNIIHEANIGSVGDVISNVRILDINRKKKQITVTMRNDGVEPPTESHNKNVTVGTTDSKTIGTKAQTPLSCAETFNNVIHPKTFEAQTQNMGHMI